MRVATPPSSLVMPEKATAIARKSHNPGVWPRAGRQAGPQLAVKSSRVWVGNHFRLSGVSWFNNLARRDEREGRGP